MTLPGGAVGVVVVVGAGGAVVGGVVGGCAGSLLG